MITAQRFRAPFLPISPPPTKERPLIGLERLTNGALFNCNMCGSCLLQETACICPMQCPKGLRNVPCDGGAANSCCVDSSRHCVWYLGSELAEAHDLLAEVHVLVGIGPLRSVRVVHYMPEHIHDSVMPVRLVDMMGRSPEPEGTGLAIAPTLIEQVKWLPDVSGIHLRSVGREAILPRLLRGADLPAMPDGSNPSLRYE